MKQPFLTIRHFLINVFGERTIFMDNLLEIGKIVNTHGLRGDVKIVVWMDYPENFESIETAYAAVKGGYKKLTVQGIKYQKNNLIVKFKELNDINEAEPLKNSVIYAEREELGELPEGTHYIVDLLGLDIVDEDGNHIGVLEDVFNTGANDIYDVKREGKKNLLLPVIDEVVKNIDIENGRIVVNVMEGLDDEN